MICSRDNICFVARGGKITSPLFICCFHFLFDRSKEKIFLPFFYNFAIQKYDTIDIIGTRTNRETDRELWR